MCSTAPSIVVAADPVDRLPGRGRGAARRAAADSTASAASDDEQLERSHHGRCLERALEVARVPAQA